jgi:hypothetical protein
VIALTHELEQWAVKPLAGSFRCRLPVGRLLALSCAHWLGVDGPIGQLLLEKVLPQTTRTHGPLYSSSIRSSQQDSLLYI